MKNTVDIRKLTTVSILIAIQLILSATPIGFISWGVTRATTMHIPVIIGAILLGPKIGALLGGVFGLISLVTNIVTPTITSFVFSPFYSVGANSGNLYSLVIVFVPRILIGIVAGTLFLGLQKVHVSKTVSCILAGIAGSLTNTVLVMSGIFVFFGQNYASAKQIAYSELLGVIGTVISTNGVMEAVLAAILIPLIARPLLKIYHDKKSSAE